GLSLLLALYSSCFHVSLLLLYLHSFPTRRSSDLMGSGGMVVMDEDDCMVDIAKFFLDFTVDESCGKCTPCREGTKRMLEILEKITSGDGEEGDIEKMEDLAEIISIASLCGLGQTAANPVVSTLKYFRNEYE